MIWRILAAIIGLAALLFVANYALQFASSKNHLWFMGWVVFILALWGFYKLLMLLTKERLNAAIKASEEVAP
jgi:ABC-type multidrug transport system permease subunit